ncbi:hypothetical protein [Microbispora amethystogenes]|uniref:Uncharacterized protein n=1 Tax=Microbispora amethystogenes TaxID=1427754 RepID=A0ABQ4FHL5_9ACTN|nr:hypothetical protein [Microbispora amethystogenes]GIH34324.1 hypothetical protein Mam01_44880 [Microbispora amethystogenes]
MLSAVSKRWGVAGVMAALVIVAGTGWPGGSATARATAGLAASPTPTASPTPYPTNGPEFVYVANAHGPVTAYPTGSTGAVSPVRQLADPGDPNTYWGPWGIAFDISGNAYAQSFLSNATTFVYSPGATTPGRMFRVAGPDSRAVAVDTAGYAYVTTGQAETAISVAAPGARGTAANLYTVPEVRRIPLDEGFHPWPGVLTTDTSGHVIAAVARSNGNAVEFFAGGPSGSATPVRVIAGPHTGLGSCSSTCDQIAVAYSAFTGRLYVAVSQGQQTRINVYAGNASGDAAPVRVISGPATGLAGKVITGIAGSQVDGTIYVLTKAAAFNSPGSILAFDRLAGGNTPPRRTFTDSGTGLLDGLGIAVSFVH